MRISTATMNQYAVNGILNQESAYAATQNQIASGKKVSTPSDDPVASVQISVLTATGANNTQYTSNGQAATTRLTLEQTALSDTTTTLQSIRDLLIQANSGSNNASNLQAIATQIQSLESSLQSIGNRQDAQGEYLFSGNASTTQPLVRDNSGSMTYAGTGSTRSVQVDSGLSVQTSDPGSSVFMNIASGNGTFTTAASGANTGTGVIDTGSVTSKSAWVADTYSISFTDGSDYQVTDSSGNVVANGTYNASSGGQISFNGVEVGISGTPAAGDSFTVAPSGTQGVFTTLDNIVSALNSAGSDSASRAQLSSMLNGSVQQMDQALNQVSTVTTAVGTRLNLVTSVATSMSNRNLALQTQISNLGDLDYASATSKLEQEYVGLQAVEATYAQIAQLSLFKYLS